MGRRCSMMIVCFCFFFSIAANALTPDTETVVAAAYGALASYQGEWEALPGQYFERRGWESSMRNNPYDSFFWAKKVWPDGHKTYIVAVTGTESKTDMKTNLDTSLVPFESSGDQKVHKGYYGVAQSIKSNPLYQSIIESVQKNPADRLVISGHSLGGAVAILLGRLTVDGGIGANRVQVITFGAPLMGNTAFLDTIPAYSIQSYMLKMDIVPEIFQAFNHTYSGSIPNAVEWQSHTPDVSIPHAMIRYLDEAERLDADAYGSAKENFQKRETPHGTMYAALPKIVSSYAEVPELVQKDYCWAMSKAMENIGQTGLYVSYRPETLEAALSKARQFGFYRLVWTEISFVSNRTSQIQNYHMELSQTRYDVKTGKPIGWYSTIFDNGAYTLLPVTLFHLDKEWRMVKKLN